MAEKEAKHYHLYDNERKEVKLEQSDGEKDIGVLVDVTISFRTHIQNQINKAQYNGTYQKDIHVPRRTEL